VWPVFANDAALSEGCQQFRGSIEVRQFDICRTDALRIVRIGADSTRQTELLCEFRRLEIVVLIRDFGIKHFDDVHIAGPCKRLQDWSPHSGALRVERVGRVHQSTLCSDPLDYVGHGQHVRNPLGKKQTDQLSRRGPNLFPNNDPSFEVTHERGFRGLDRMMIGDAHHVESHRFHPLDQLVNGGARVTRRQRVQMTIKSNEAGASRRRWPNRIQQQQQGD
jgi:hypothetical protein